MEKYFEELSNDELITGYGLLIDEMKKRNMIRTNNLVGELGEMYAIKYYNNNPNLPNLEKTKIGEQEVDAIDNNQMRYAIKSVSSRTTGTFHGIDLENPTQVFDFLIIVKFNKVYQLEAIYQLGWNDFMNFKKLHTTMKAWNILITKKLEKEAVRIFPVIP